MGQLFPLSAVLMHSFSPSRGERNNAQPVERAVFPRVQGKIKDKMIFQNRGQFGGQVPRSCTDRYYERAGTSKWPGFGKLYRWKATKPKTVRFRFCAPNGTSRPPFLHKKALGLPVLFISYSLNLNYGQTFSFVTLSVRRTLGSPTSSWINASHT